MKKGPRDIGQKGPRDVGQGPRDIGQRSERYWSKVREMLVNYQFDQYLSDLDQNLSDL